VPVRVADASVVAALAFQEPDAARAATWLEGGELYAPSLLAIVLATGLSVHDASYVSLARSLGAELVSFDTDLLAAAGKLAG